MKQTESRKAKEVERERNTAPFPAFLFCFKAAKALFVRYLRHWRLNRSRLRTAPLPCGTLTPAVAQSGLITQQCQRLSLQGQFCS